MKNYLTRNDWASDVKLALNTFIGKYGRGGDCYSENNYVVFDFDNTVTIFDIEDQLAVYQLRHMAFAMTPSEMEKMLPTGLTRFGEDLTAYGFGKGTYEDWIDDITRSYKYLYETYGPFSAKGLSEADVARVNKDPMWTEFAAKLNTLYDLIGKAESHDVAAPWILYWFYGMTEEEVYELAKRSHEYYGKLKTSKEIWTTSPDIDSKVGTVSFTWPSGVSITENIKELLKAMHESGIKVWICSASGMEPVKAAVDVFGIHDYIEGVMAFTTARGKDGKYTNAYDYETGYPFRAVPRAEGGASGWERMNRSQGSQTYRHGKVTAIENVLVPLYGCGPIAGFMDANGDFAFCTEFDSLKLTCCFNRGNRRITDGGGLVAEIAIYQRDTLHLDLTSASEQGDIFFILQGRDENGDRTFRNSNLTVRLGESQEKLFGFEDNFKQLQYMIDNKLTTKQALALYKEA